MALNSQFINAVKVEMRDMIKREPQLANDPLASLINQGRTKAYRSTQRFVKTIEFEDIDSPVFGNDQLTGATNDQILPASPDYTIPEFYTRGSHSEAGHVRVAVPRILQRALGQNSAEAAKVLSKEILSGAQRRLLRYTIRGLGAPVVQNPIIENTQSPTSRSVVEFPVAHNLLARPLVAGQNGAPIGAPLLTPENKMWAETYLANLCQTSLHSPMPVGESINKAGKIYIFSNSGWTAFMTSNLQILGNRDFFGDSFYQKGLSGVATMGGDTYITIPDSQYIALNDTAIGGARNEDLIIFRETPMAARGIGVVSGVSYTSGNSDGPNTNATSRGLHSCYILYPDAYEFGETEQYTDLGLEINIDPERSNEKYIYALVSRESMRMWDQGVVRVWFGGPGSTVMDNT